MKGTSNENQRKLLGKSKQNFGKSRKWNENRSKMKAKWKENLRKIKKRKEKQRNKWNCLKIKRKNIHISEREASLRPCRAATWPHRRSPATPQQTCAAWPAGRPVALAPQPTTPWPPLSSNLLVSPYSSGPYSSGGPRAKLGELILPDVILPAI